MTVVPIHYNTSSDFKKQELSVVLEHSLRDGRTVGDVFGFRFSTIAIQEDLEVDLVKMVSSEARKAYAELKVPCIVEHAGLVFKKYLATGYPGGLTKPMWNTLGDSFLSETGSAGAECVARAVIAYCDGTKIHAFIGETQGRLSSEYLGDRKF